MNKNTFVGICWLTLATLLFVGALVGIASSLMTILFPRQCAARTEGLGYEHRWSYLGGCQINVNGRWVPLSNYVERRS